MDARVVQKPAMQAKPVIRDSLPSNSDRLARTTAFWDNRWMLNRRGQGPRSCANYFEGFVGINGLVDNSVLDVGCGDLTIGARMNPVSISSFLRKNAESYTGLDASGVAICNSRFAYPSDRFEVGDAAKLPFTGRSFDLAISFDMITLMGTEYRKAISEMARVAEKGIMFDVLHKDWLRATRYGPHMEIDGGVTVRDWDGIQKVGLEAELLRGTLNSLGFPKQEIKVLSLAEHWLMVNSAKAEDCGADLADVKMHILVKAFRE